MNKVSNFSASLPVLVILFLSLFSLIADILSVVRWLFTIVWKEHLGFKSTQSNSRYFRGHKYIATTVPKPMFAFPLGAMFYMLPNKQAFQGILHPHSRKHNYLAHFFKAHDTFSLNFPLGISFYRKGPKEAALGNLYFMYCEVVC